MILSIWRYSHLAFSLSFSAFILIASLTGVILAFNPINEQIENNHLSSEAKKQSVAKTIVLLKKEYSEVVSFEINTHNQVIADVVTQNGDSKQVFINPINGKIIGTPKESHPMFKWATSLHRSLFLKKTGRFLVGLCSFFLCLIALTGIILISKRQGGIFKFFTKIVKENTHQYFHIVLGKWSIIPIILLTLTGLYLSLEKFSVLPEIQINHSINFDKLNSEPNKELQNFTVFDNIQLKDIKRIEFPFSDDVEDYYTLYLNNKEIFVNQVTGDVISEQIYPLHKIIAYYSFILHTGHGSVLWAIVLLLACLGILYFMYSGFAMTLSRRNTKIKNRIKKQEAEILILYGSEGGTTLNYANALHKQLLLQNKKSYITELNKFSKFKSVKKLLIITATYGNGEAPNNAKKFIRKFKKDPSNYSFEYAILGFGSNSYPHFCKFAYDIQTELYSITNAKEIIDVTTVNNRSFEAFTQWINKLSSSLDIEINIKKIDLGFKKLKTKPFCVKDITPLKKQVDNTFLLELSPPKNTKFNSGDLLAIYPENNDKERLYSIAKTKENSILISVKKHEKGVVSNYLHKQKIKESINASIIKNNAFHFPKKTTKVILIATGTGIGPFLGMLANNTKRTTVNLYWGGRNENSFNLYKNCIDELLENGKLQSFYLAYSRSSTPKTYVQNIIQEHGNYFANSLSSRTIIMLCGSVTMQQEVTKVLNTICSEKGIKPLSYYQNKGQILMDCY